MEQEFYFKWYHTFLFFFQTVLSIVDIVTDILTSRDYKKQGHETWFAVSLGFTVVSIIVLCVWSSIASTLRTLTKQDDEDVEVVNPDFIFRHPVVNVLLSCLCFGPPLHSLQLFFVCALRFKDLWKSERGIRIEKAGRLYYLYTHNLNMKMVEGLLESAPQLLIQLYVMLHPQSKIISTIQMISAPVSFIMLTWMITSTERCRELTNNHIKLHHHVLLFIGNAGIIVARSVAIVAFTLVYPWWLAVMLPIHFFLTIACGYMLWGSKRKQDILTFIFAYSPLYLFVYNRYYLSKLRGNNRFSILLQNSVSIAWHVLFFAENITMVMLYYTADYQRGRLSDVVALSIVVVGNVGGLLFKCVIRHCCFKVETQLNDPRQRAVTIQIRTLPRQV